MVHLPAPLLVLLATKSRSASTTRPCDPRVKELSRVVSKKPLPPEASSTWLTLSSILTAMLAKADLAVLPLSLASTELMNACGIRSRRAHLTSSTTSCSNSTSLSASRKTIAVRALIALSQLAPAKLVLAPQLVQSNNAAPPLKVTHGNTQ